MKRLSFKHLVINQLIKFRRFKNRYFMVQFVKKNWFYVGLAVLAVVYFRKELKTYFHSSSQSGQEKFTQATPPENGQSLFGIGTTEAATPTTNKVAMPEIKEGEAKAFLRRFAKVSQGEFQKFKVPASAFLALAYINSHAGQRTTATEANNYFARACGSQWEGERLEQGGQCFRRYERPWDSFRDASSQLSATRWAQALVQGKEMGWEKWVEAFAENGYSDVQNAKEEMTKVIQAYRLFELD
jgi:flagellum-specific peptidoglycan hydrolase FlgJ